MKNLLPENKYTRKRVRVEPFLAFGNHEEILVKGRVINSYMQSRPSSRKSWISNIVSAIRRYSGSSVPNAKVQVDFNEQSIIVNTDEDGVFELQIGESFTNENHSEFVNFKVIEPETRRRGATGHREVVRYDQETGVISDVDDTILISHATDLGKKFWLAISKNAYSRRPLPGVSEFYKELTGFGKYPIFYVSSSDWSLFDMINDFMNYRHIPHGPLLLKDKHINLRNILKSGGGSHQHKLMKIKALMEMYPKMNFYLVGDSGQHDPEIYSQIIQEFPGRVIAVFVRLIGALDPERAEKLKKEHNFPNFFFIESSKEAIEIAQKHNFVKET